MKHYDVICLVYTIAARIRDQEKREKTLNDKVNIQKIRRKQKKIESTKVNVK